MTDRSPDNRRSERGNFFTVLLASIGLAGMLGVVTYNMMSGPLATLSRAGAKGITDGDLIAASRVMILDAATQNDGGDCDSDGYIEPRGWETSANNAPTGGGKVPTTIGAAATDAWGTPIGYCVWDIGTNTSTCGNNGANRLNGTPDPLTGETVSQTVMAVISAGPDRRFNSTCADYSNGTTAVAVRGGDDIMHTYSYSEASVATSAIWKLKSGDASTGQLTEGKDVEVGGNITLDESTGAAEFAAMTADGRVDAGGGAMVGDSATAASCGTSDIGLIRYTAGSGSSTINVEQSTPFREGRPDLDTVSFSTLPAAGSTIIVYVYGAAMDGTTGTLTGMAVTDNQGNTYTPIAATQDLHSNADQDTRGYILAAYNITAPTGTFTLTVDATYSASSYAVTWGAIEVSGLASTSVLDQMNTYYNGNAGATDTISTPGPTTQATEIAIALHVANANDSTFNYGHDSSWTEHFVCNAVSSYPCLSAVSKVLSSTGVVSHQWSHDVDATVRSGALIATFKGGGNNSSIQYCNGTDWTDMGDPGTGSTGSAGGGKWTRATDDIHYNTGAVNIGSAEISATALMKVSGSSPKMSIRNISDCGDSCGGTLDLYRARGSEASPKPTSSTDILGKIVFEGRGASAYVTAAEIVATATGTPRSTYTPAKAEFKVQNDQGNLRTVTTITPTGMGLGTATPSEKLHIVSGIENMPPPSIVQQIATTQVATGMAAGGTSVAAMPQNVTAGNVMVVVVGACRALGAAASNVGNITASDTIGGAYSVYRSNDAMARVAIFYKTLSSSGANTITITNPAANTSYRWGAYEISGLDTSSLLDRTAQGTGTAANTTASTGSATAAVTFAIAAAAHCSNDTTMNYAPAANWTQDYVHQSAQNGAGMSAVTRILTSSSPNLQHQWTHDAPASGGGHTARGARAIVTLRGYSTAASNIPSSIMLDSMNAAASTSTDISFQRSVDLTVPTVVQTMPKRLHAFTDPLNSSSQSFSTLPTAGNTIIVTIGGTTWDDPSLQIPPNGVTDNQGNTYVRVAESDTWNEARSYIYAAYNIGAPSGTFTITVDPSSSDNHSLHWGALEVSGIRATGALDSTGISLTDNPGSSITVDASNASTTATSFAVAIQTTSTATNSMNYSHEGYKGWTEAYTNNDCDADGGLCMSVVYNTITNPGIVSHRWLSPGSTRGNTAAIAVFKPNQLPGTGTLRNNDVVGRIDFNGYDGDSHETVARVEGIVNTTVGGAVSNTNLPVDLSFKVGDQTDNLKEAMRIDSRGYVGIYRKPAVRLDINTGVFLATDVADVASLTGYGRRVAYSEDHATFVGGELTSGWSNAWDTGNMGVFGFAYGTDVHPTSGYCAGCNGLIIGKNMNNGANTSMLIGENYGGSPNHTRSIGKNNDSDGPDTGTTQIGNDVRANGWYSVALGNNIRAGDYSDSAFAYYIGNNLRHSASGGTNEFNFIVGLSSAGNNTTAPANNRMAVLSGNWGIGTAAPAHSLDVVGSAVDDDSTVWANTSDMRLKDIAGSYDKGLSEIVRLRPVTFSYKEGNAAGYDSSALHVGFVAQEVQPVFPEAVSMRENDGYLDLNLHSVSIAEINALKTLDSQNRSLRDANNALRTENAKARDKLAALRTRVAALKDNPAFEHLSKSPWTGLWLLPAVALAGFAHFRRRKGGTDA